MENVKEFLEVHRKSLKPSQIEMLERLDEKVPNLYLDCIDWKHDNQGIYNTGHLAKFRFENEGVKGKIKVEF